MSENDENAVKIGQDVAQTALKTVENAPWLAKKSTKPTLSNPKGAKKVPYRSQTDATKPNVLPRPEPKHKEIPPRPNRRKRYEPTTAHRNRVINAMAMGFSAVNIAMGLNISKPTLYKHYKREMTAGKEMALMKVGGKIYEAALQCNEDAAFVPAAKYYENTRGNVVTKTASEVDHSSKDGSMATLPALVVIPDNGTDNALNDEASASEAKPTKKPAKKPAKTPKGK